MVVFLVLFLNDIAAQETTERLGIANVQVRLAFWSAQARL